MTNFKIETEDSSDALRYVDCKNKNVLDLGCGRWCSREGDWNNLKQSEFTPFFFSDRGASKVVGVDISKNEIDIFNELTKNEPADKFYFINEKVETPEQILGWINKYNINYLKSDIEGYETCMLSLTKEDLSQIDEFVLEYHTYEIRDSFIEKFPEWGFEVYANGEVWVDGIGVLFAKR